MLLCVLNFFICCIGGEEKDEEEKWKSTHRNNKVCFIIFHASVAAITFYSRANICTQKSEFLLNFHWILFHFSLPAFDDAGLFHARFLCEVCLDKNLKNFPSKNAINFSLFYCVSHPSNNFPELCIQVVIFHL